MSNLLSTASLVVTPSSYKEGKLYSVIPSDGSGDFTFTRATTATRVNSDGLVELVPYNLVTWSQDFTNANWIKSGTASIATGQIFRCGSTATSQLLSTSLSVGAGEFRTISVYAKPENSNFIVLTIGDLASSAFYRVWYNVLTGQLGSSVTTGVTVISPTAFISGPDDSGRYRCEITAKFVNATTTRFTLNISNSNNVFDGNASSGVYIYGAQLVEGTNALPYQRTETRLNIPRIDSSLGGCPSILLEPQRTNLTLYSSYFDNAYWFKENATISANLTISPSGVQDADALTDNTTNSRHRIYNVFSGTIGTNYTLSIYVKKNSPNRFLLLNAAAVIGQRSVLNLDTLAITNLNGTSGQVVDAGNGWYRFSISGTALVASGVIYYQMQNSNTDVSYIGDGSSFYLWGAQLEAGSYATSYIPTTTASVTRNNEICEKLSISSLIGQSEGTLYFEGSNIGAFTEICNINRSTTNSVWFISQSDQTLRATIYANGTAVTINSSVLTTSIFKAAIAYKTNSIAFYVNGVLIGQNTSATFTPNVAMENLYVNQGGYLGVKNKVNAKAVALWKERLTNDQLAQLTTL